MLLCLNFSCLRGHRGWENLGTEQKYLSLRRCFWKTQAFLLERKDYQLHERGISAVQNEVRKGKRIVNIADFVMIIWDISLLCTLPLLLLLWCCVMAVPVKRRTAYYKALCIGNWQLLEFSWKKLCLANETFCLSANAFRGNPNPKSIERTKKEISTVWNQVSGRYLIRYLSVLAGIRVDL